MIILIFFNKIKIYFCFCNFLPVFCLNSKTEIRSSQKRAFFPVDTRFRSKKIGRLRLGCLDSRTVGPNNRLPWGKGPIRSNSDEIAVIGWNNMWLSPAILGYGSSDNITSTSLSNPRVKQKDTRTRGNILGYTFIYIY